MFQQMNISLFKCFLFRRLKNDLQYLRRKGLLKAPGESSYQGRKCARCCAPFGRFYNTGATCTRCRYRVCRQCRIEVRGPNEENETGKDVEWICNVCYKIAWVTFYISSFHHHFLLLLLLVVIILFLLFLISYIEFLESYTLSLANGCTRIHLRERSSMRKNCRPLWTYWSTVYAVLGL